MEQDQIKKRIYQNAGNFIFLLLLVILLIAIYTAALQKNYSDNTLEAAVTRDISCADAIHRVVSNKFTRADYTEINSVDDMNTPRYRELQKSLNELRTLNFTRYLYTAKRNEEGRLVYLVDGLDLSAEDFAYPGTYIEEEMVPYIEKALAGETVYSQEIIDTTWGHIFTACYPVEAEDGSGEIVGALCMEMDMEDSYQFLEKCSKASVLAALTAVFISIFLFLVVYLSAHKQKEKEMEQQQLLEKSAAMAQSANQAKSTFLFNMSHDIRTPMNAIIGYADLAGKHLDEREKLQRYIQNIQICGQRMLSIIDSVLEFARIENDKAVLDESICKVGDCFDACMIMFQSALEEKKQTMTITKNIQYPYLYMDSAHVTEILLNIISNAVKYTGNGGSVDCILDQEEDGRPGWCRIKVVISDTGIGMSEDFQKHIFESFSREQSSTVSGIEGTGLGMGIVKKLIDLMNGTIEVDSKVGEGSTFTVRIPCRIACPEEVKAEQAKEVPEKEDFTGRRLLLAEDNDLNAEITIELLGEENFAIDRAKNGEECLKMLEEAPDGYYDLILMDVQMPVLNGYEATRKIRKLEDPEKAGIPIIAMTANAFAEDRLQALKEGMNDHVAKPIDMKTLIPVLKKYLK